MKITIITTSLNAASTIVDTINSVLQAGFSDFEHIVVDAGSSDGTIELLRSYPHLIIHVLPKISIPSAWNFGIECARGDVIWILNADDFIQTNSFNEITSLFSKYDQPIIVVGKVSIVDGFGNILRVVRGNVPHSFNIYRGLPFLHPSVIFSKNLYKSVGQFNDSLRVGFDSNWLIRAYSEKVLFIQASHHVIMRAGGLSDTRSWVGFGEYLETLQQANIGLPTIIAALLNKSAVLFKRLIISKFKTDSFPSRR